MSRSDLGPIVWIGDRKRPLTIDEVVGVAREAWSVRIAPEGAARVVACRKVVDVLVAKNIKAYGVTTGFASLRDRVLTAAEAKALSTCLIRSHATGLGRPFAEDVVRAAMLLRANTLAQGNSGVRLSLLRRLVAMINARVFPYVPEQGSLGSSGDLAPLSHVILVLMGDAGGRVHDGSRESEDAVDAHADFMRLHRTSCSGSYAAEPTSREFKPLDASELAQALKSSVDQDGLPGTCEEATRPEFELLHKEGLACNNGAVFTAAVAALACHDSERLLTTADLVAALSFESLQAVKDCIDERVVDLRSHPGHVRSAANMREALQGSSLVRDRAPVGVNMAAFNRTLLDLKKKETEAQGEDVKALADLREWMSGHQATFLSDIEKERALPGKQAESAKTREVRACRAAFEPIAEKWRHILGWSGSEPAGRMAPSVRETLATIYQDHVSKIVRPENNPEVQDNYSFRAAATVTGTGWEALARCRAAVEIEMQATTDNPIICLDRLLDEIGLGSTVPSADEMARALETHWPSAADAIVSAANFHGEPVGAPCDHLAAAIAEVGNISERRVAVLTDKAHSKNLPSYLSWNPGLNSGFMMPQYTAASLVIENRHLAIPASTDSVPTGEMSEDHVAVSMYAARKLATVISQAERIVGVEMLNAYQGVQFRRPCQLGALTGSLEAMLAERIGPLILALGEYKTLERLRARLVDLGVAPGTAQSISPCVIDDVVVYPLMESCAALIRRGNVAGIAASSAQGARGQ